MYIVGRDIAKEGEPFSCYQETLHDTLDEATADYRNRDQRGDKRLFIAKMYTIKINIELVDPDQDWSDKVL